MTSFLSRCCNAWTHPEMLLGRSVCAQCGQLCGPDERTESASVSVPRDLLREAAAAIVDAAIEVALGCGWRDDDGALHFDVNGAEHDYQALIDLARRLQEAAAQ